MIKSPLLLIIKVYKHLKLNKNNILYKQLHYDFSHYDSVIISLLDDKISLYELTKEFDIMPTTYIIKSKDDFVKNNKNNIWFLKNSRTNCGRGIYIGTCRKLEEIYNLNNISKYFSFVLQPEIKPFLINNKKFSIRCLILISNRKFYIHKYGIIHIAINDYKSNDSSKETQLSYSDANSHNEIPFKENYENYNEFFEQIVTICKKLKVSIKDVLNKSYKSYIMGMDVMVDDNKRCWLLELNVPPGMSDNGKIYDQVNYHIINDLIYLIIMNDKNNGFVEI